MNDLTPLSLARSTPAAGLEVEVVTGLSGFNALRAEWSELFDRAAAPHQVFQSFALLSAWAKAYAGDGRGLTVVTARIGGRLVAAVPLMRQRRFGIDILQFMGAPVAQFDDMLADPACGEDILAAIWAGIERLGADLLQARRIREDGAFWRLGRRETVVFETMEAPYANLLARVESGEPGPAYSSKDRSNLRRRMRRLGERGSLALRSCPPGSEAGNLVEPAIEMKTAALQRQGVYWRTVGCTRFSDFFRHVAADNDSGLRVSSIELDGKPIGVDLSFLCKGVGFGHVLATDGAFEREGLGQLLVHHVFAEMRSHGAARFDLLAPADPYKMHHADGVTRVESRAYAFTPRGRLAAQLGYRLAMPAARRMANWLPGWAMAGAAEGISASPG